MKHAILVLALTALLGGCGGGGGGAAAVVARVTVVFTQPANDQTVAVGVVIQITYADNDLEAPDDATSDLFAVPVTGGLQTVTIALARPNSGGADQTMGWDTTGVAPGVYRIQARTTDGIDTVTAFAPGRVTITTATLAFNGLATDQTVSLGGIVCFAFVDNAPGEDATTTIYADVDGDLSTTGDQFEITSGPDTDGVEQTVCWNTAGVPPGTYCIVAQTTLADGSVTATAAGKITVQDVLCAARAGGPEMFYFPESLAAFPDGSFVVAGSFCGVATFGPGEPGETVLNTGFGGTFFSRSDLFVAKYNADCTLAWARSDGGDGHDAGHNVHTFPDGSCIVAGFFGATSGAVPVPAGATFGAGEPNETMLDGMGEFLARYAADGTLLWVREESSVSVVAVPDGSLFVTGSFEGTETFGEGETNETTLTAAGGSDLFIARHNEDGTLAWVRAAHGAGNDGGSLIGAFDDGSAVVIGGTSDMVTFGAGEPTETTINAIDGLYDFVARYAADGSFVWAKPFVEGFLNVSALDKHLATHADGSFFVAGQFFETITVAPGEPGETKFMAAASEGDVLVTRYDADGALAWARSFGALNGANSRSVAPLPLGGVAVSASTIGTVTFGVGEPAETTHTGGSLVARFNADGSFAGLINLRTAVMQGGDTGKSISTHPDGAIVVTGDFGNVATFFAGTPRETVLTSEGGNDIFVARFNAGGP